MPPNAHVTSPPPLFPHPPSLNHSYLLSADSAATAIDAALHHSQITHQTLLSDPASMSPTSLADISASATAIEHGLCRSGDQVCLLRDMLLSRHHFFNASSMRLSCSYACSLSIRVSKPPLPFLSAAARIYIPSHHRPSHSSLPFAPHHTSPPRCLPLLHPSLSSLRSQTSSRPQSFLCS
jgi:hypothetical protein